MSTKSIQEFQTFVLQQGEGLYRDLPWRYVKDPYQVFLSEVMLQQTQVSRVQERWESWLEVFPAIQDLAAAPQALVLQQWQGMGYNRRALALKRAADVIVQEHQGVFPQDEASLLALPGVGPATAAGIQAFAFNQPAIYLETNVRTVFLHEFFPDIDQVPDSVLKPLVGEYCYKDDPRRWYYALLDYGAHLKKQIPNPSRRSKHYAKQSTFEGSNRQKRAALLRLVLQLKNATFDQLYDALCTQELEAQRPAPTPDLALAILDALVKEGFILQEGNCYFPA